MDEELQPIDKASEKDESTLIRAVHDRYRCPKGFLDFRLNGELAPDSGYFQFGAQTTCYGRSVKSPHQLPRTSPVFDMLTRVTFDGPQLLLPFDPNEVIDNLRLERYPGGQFGKGESVLKGMYYRLRPLTNRTLRKWIQKFRAADWQKKPFPQWPVDTSVENICDRLLGLSLRARRVDRIPFIWFWPRGARGCVSMTHDVETVAGRDFCAQLLDIDDSFGIKASFQIVPEGQYPITSEFLKQLRGRGCEVNVHDLNHDGRLFDEREEFRRRSALINQYGREYGAKGFRSAVLYRKPEWYADLDFAFDMSFPNVAHLDPQRGGCCTVMPYFIGDVLELPLTTVQDYTLFHLLDERSIDLWKNQIEVILSKYGLATFLVHPDYITKPDARGVYMDLLAMLDRVRKRDELWFALPFDIDTWWRARRRMSIVQDCDSWRIVGDGAERAMLAFAKMVDGRLTYELAGAQQRELPAERSFSENDPSSLPS
jgi:hypothetical protein